MFDNGNLAIWRVAWSSGNTAGRIPEEDESLQNIILKTTLLIKDKHNE